MKKVDIKKSDLFEFKAEVKRGKLVRSTLTLYNLPNTRKRHKATQGITVGGWVYESSEEMDFAIACANHDLGLPSFDEFIDSLPNGVGKDELMWLRNETLRAYLEDNESAFLGWLQAMWLRWSIALNLPRLWPTLLHGEKFQNSKRGYSKLYRVAEKILIDNGADYPAKDVWRKLESLAKKGHPAIQEVEGDVDSDEAKHVFVYWIDDKGKEQKTSFKQFQSQLSGHRKTLPNF